jgi:hypothetical protein
MNTRNSSASKATPTRNAKPQTISTDSKSNKSPAANTQKNSNKSTPVADIRDKSASKRSVTPTSAKERAPGTPKVTPQQARSASTKKTQELQAPSISKSNQASANKSPSKKTPQTMQQTTLTPGNPRYVKSAQSSSRKPETQDILPGLKPISEDIENEGLTYDMRKDLNVILDTEVVDIRATQINDVTPSKQASAAKTRSQQKSASESKKSRDKSGTRLDLEGIEVRGSNRGSEVKIEEAGIDAEDRQEEQAEERTNFRKEYSAYEDWRILETVESQIPEGSKISRSFWNTIDDPLTGKRLLEGKRTSESLRDRYKRYIASLDEVGKETLREFAQNNDTETMKKYHCLFKKVGGLKQFVGVSDQLNYNPERMQRKTPYGTKSTKEKEEQKTTKSRRKNVGQVEKDFEEEGNPQMEQEIAEFEDDIIEVTERDITFAAPVKTKQFEVQRPSAQQANQRKPNNATSTRTIIRDHVIPVQQQRVGGVRQERRALADFDGEDFPDFEMIQPELQEFVSLDEMKRKNNKRKVPKDDNYEAVVNTVAPAVHREMKKVRITSQYDDSSLQLNNVFSVRKQGYQSRNGDEGNLMVLVDLNKGFRQFVRENPEEEEDREVEKRKLKKLSEKYKIPFNEIVIIFGKVSSDYADLEEFLKRKDAKLLWTDEEDSDLLENNHTAIKYLKILKGDERVDRRVNYLMSH